MNANNQSQRLDGKVAVVTGGTSGIGFAIACELLREGAHVVVTSLPQDEQEGRQAFAELGYEPFINAGDMAEEDFRQGVVAQILERHGGLHYLVNNAFSFLAKGLDGTIEDWQYSLAVGPVAYAHMMQLVAEPMKKVGGGAIVNITSISAYIAQPNRWTYNAAKAAVLNLTRCAALDLAKFNIRVNSVSPGWIWTREVENAAQLDGGGREKWEPIWGQYHMMERCGNPEEVARAVIFLLSDDASFITATDLPVDGGYLGMGSEGLGKNTVLAGSK